MISDKKDVIPVLNDLIELMKQDEKKLFDTYPIPFWIYEDIDEDEARDIFNELQNFLMGNMIDWHYNPIIDFQDD